MYDEENKNLSNQSSDQKNEKRKKKKRRGKTSSTEEKEESGPSLPTVSSIVSGKDEKLPIDDYPKRTNNPQEENRQQPPNRLRGRRNMGAEDQKVEKPKYDRSYNVYPLSNDMKTMKERITFKEEESPEKNNNINQLDENERTNLRGNMNKYFKRANIVDDEQKKKDNDNGIPSKDIDPNELFVVDEDDGEIDYLEGQKAYELSVFLDSHVFINKVKNFEKPFVDLVKRKIIRFEKNLLDLVDKNLDKFFILYELQVSEHTDLCLTEIASLTAIKSIFLSYPSVHLIIFISDEEMSNKYLRQYDNSLINDNAQDKLANIIIFLDLDQNDENRVHAFSSKELRDRNREFFYEKSKIKELINKPRLRKLFNITNKEDEKNDLLLEYPCSLAIAPNPLIYSKYIPEITKDYKCLIINSIYFMNRYQLCFDASTVLSFNEPAVIALKIVPPLKGVNGREAFTDLEEENAILSSDEDIFLYKKINDVAFGEPENKNPNLDVACQYLAFLEEDNDNYNDLIKRFEKGSADKAEVRKKVFVILRDMLKKFKEKDVRAIDTYKFMPNVS